MKTTLKILSLVCVLTMLLTFAACGKTDGGSGADDKSDASGEAASSEAQANLTDYDWVKFEMPEGWSDAKESDYYVTIAEDANSKHIMKLSTLTLVSGKTVAEYAADKSDDTHVLGDAFNVNGRDWYPLSFTFNGNDSVYLYGQADEGHVAEITVYEMTESDPAVQTVLNSIVFVPAE